MRVSRPATADLGLAAVLAGLAVVELAATGRLEVGSVLLALLATLPVAWRTAAPRLALALCLSALLVLTATRTDEFTVAELLALMLVTYTVAVLERRGPAVVALALVLASALGNSASAGSREGGDYVFPVILLGVPWAAGRALRRWRERTEELRQVTEALREEREQHARLAVAAERGRIARELHDSLAQSLNAVVVHSEVAEASLGRDQTQAASSIARIASVARSSLGETRRLLDALRELADDDPPRLDQLPTLVQEHRADGLDVELVVEGGPSGLPRAVEAAAYRIVQEGLTNVASHSQASLARVRVCIGDVLTVAVEDDGPAVPSRGSARSGLGLLGMRERAVLLGGDFRAGPEGTGFVVAATIPIGVAP